MCSERETVRDASQSAQQIGVLPTTVVLSTSPRKQMVLLSGKAIIKFVGEGENHTKSMAVVKPDLSIVRRTPSSPRRKGQERTMAAKLGIIRALGLTRLGGRWMLVLVLCWCTEERQNSPLGWYSSVLLVTSLDTTSLNQILGMAQWTQPRLRASIAQAGWLRTWIEAVRTGQNRQVAYSFTPVVWSRYHVDLSCRFL